MSESESLQRLPSFAARAPLHSPPWCNVQFALRAHGGWGEAVVVVRGEGRGEGVLYFVVFFCVLLVVLCSCVFVVVLGWGRGEKREGGYVRWGLRGGEEGESVYERECL